MIYTFKQTRGFSNFCSAIEVPSHPQSKKSDFGRCVEKSSYYFSSILLFYFVLLKKHGFFLVTPFFSLACIILEAFFICIVYFGKREREREENCPARYLHFHYSAIS